VNNKGNVNQTEQPAKQETAEEEEETEQTRIGFISTFEKIVKEDGEYNTYFETVIKNDTISGDIMDLLDHISDVIQMIRECFIKHTDTIIPYDSNKWEQLTELKHADYVKINNRQVRNSTLFGWFTNLQGNNNNEENITITENGKLYVISRYIEKTDNTSLEFLLLVNYLYKFLLFEKELLLPVLTFIYFLMETNKSLNTDESITFIKNYKNENENENDYEKVIQYLFNNEIDIEKYRQHHTSFHNSFHLLYSICIILQLDSKINNNKINDSIQSYLATYNEYSGILLSIIKKCLDYENYHRIEGFIEIPLLISINEIIQRPFTYKDIPMHINNISNVIELKPIGNVLLNKVDDWLGLSNIYKNIKNLPNNKIDHNIHPGLLDQTMYGGYSRKKYTRKKKNVKKIKDVKKDKNTLKKKNAKKIKNIKKDKNTLKKKNVKKIKDVKQNRNTLKKKSVKKGGDVCQQYYNNPDCIDKVETVQLYFQLKNIILHYDKIKEYNFSCFTKNRYLFTSISKIYKDIQKGLIRKEEESPGSNTISSLNNGSNSFVNYTLKNVNPFSVFNKRNNTNNDNVKVILERHREEDTQNKVTIPKIEMISNIIYNNKLEDKRFIIRFLCKYFIFEKKLLVVLLFILHNTLSTQDRSTQDTPKETLGKIVTAFTEYIDTYENAEQYYSVTYNSITTTIDKNELAESIDYIRIFKIVLCFLYENYENIYYKESIEAIIQNIHSIILNIRVIYSLVFCLIYNYLKGEIPLENILIECIDNIVIEHSNIGTISKYISTILISLIECSASSNITSTGRKINRFFNVNEWLKNNNNKTSTLQHTDIHRSVHGIIDDLNHISNLKSFLTNTTSFFTDPLSTFVNHLLPSYSINTNVA